MSKRSLASKIYTPEELDVLCNAFRRACAECNLTGDSGRTFLARALMARYKIGVTQEDDLVGIARTIVWRRRGLNGRSIAANRNARSNARVTKT